MLEIFKSSKGKLNKIPEPVTGAWINIEKPTAKDLEELKKLVALPDDEIILSLEDINELARTEKEPDFTFIVFRMPYKVKGSDGTEYSSAPLGVIIHKDYLITVSFFENDIIKKLKAGYVSSGKKIKTTLEILFITAKTYLIYLKEIRQQSKEIQKKLETSLKNEELIKLLNLSNSLVYFNTSISSNGILIDKLTKNKIFTQFEEDRELLEDVLIENKQALELTNIYANILNGTMDAFASIISNNLNIVMKRLTTITIILMIPTLIASIYGMNVELPFQHEANAFAIVVFISILVSLIGIFIFRKKSFFMKV